MNMSVRVLHFSAPRLFQWIHHRLKLTLTSSTWVSGDLRLSSHGAVDEWFVTLINSRVCVIIMISKSVVDNQGQLSLVSSKLKYRTLLSPLSLFYSFTEVISLLLLTFNEREPTISQHFHFGPAFIFLPQKGWLVVVRVSTWAQKRELWKISAISDSLKRKAFVKLIILGPRVCNIADICIVYLKWLKKKKKRHKN